MIAVILIAAVVFLSYANGANDNFKGVATLYGSNTASYRFSLLWTSVFTFLGASLSVILAATLIKNFSGKGLLPEDVINTNSFVIATAMAAASTVFVASKIGMPVSTTHALIGGLVGAGLLAAGSQVHFDKLGKAFMMPLLLSPLVAGLLSFLLYSVLHRIRVRKEISKELCVCYAKPLAPIANLNTIAIVSSPLIIAESQSCEAIYAGKIIGIPIQATVKNAHFLSAAVVCFSRGLNDAPKIAGLLLLLHMSDMRLALLGIAVAMIIGGLLHSKKIAGTMSKNITSLNHGQAFSANFITGCLVLAASFFALPVSTTHVSVGSIFGIGLKTGKNNKKVAMQILLSWVLTLPVAIVFSMLYYFIFSSLKL
ncbi:MAG: inorganic phosphate transporter [Bacteroidota bacterium]